MTPLFNLKSKRIMAKNKRFRKVVRYYYPNGSKYKNGGFQFYFMHVILYLLYILLSPLLYFLSDYKGKKEVYWEELKLKSK